MSNSLGPHGLQHARLPYPSPTPRAYSNSCPSHRWCHPNSSSSVVPFSSCLQYFPASGSFPMSQYFTSGSQAIGGSASVLPMNIQDWLPLGWTGWISLQSKGLSRVFSTLQFKSISSLVLSFLYSPTLTSIMTTRKTIALTRRTFVGKSLVRVAFWENFVSGIYIWVCMGALGSHILKKWFGKGGAASCLYLLCFICLPLCAQGLCTIKVCLVKAMVFPVVMYGCESWTIKKAEHRRTGAFELWC